MSASRRQWTWGLALLAHLLLACPDAWASTRGDPVLFPVTPRTHATDCSTGITTAYANELCLDLDDGRLWNCATPADGGASDAFGEALCDQPGEWVPVLGSGVLEVQVDQLLNTGDSIDCGTTDPTAVGAMLNVAGATEPITLGDPQILAGTRLGQRCLLSGADATNVVSLVNGAGLAFRVEVPEILVTPTVRLEFVWTGTLWQQVDPTDVSAPTGAVGLQANCDAECVLRNLPEERPLIIAPAGQPGPELRYFSPDGNFYETHRRADGNSADPKEVVIPIDGCLRVSSVLGTPAAEQTVGEICNQGGLTVSTDGIYAPPPAGTVEFAPTARIADTSVQTAIERVEGYTEQVLFMTVLAPSTATDTFAGLSGSGNSTDVLVPVVFPKAGKLRGLRCFAGVAPGSGKSWTIRVRINTVDANQTCVISNTGQTCDASASADDAVATADRVEYKITPASTPTGAVSLACGVLFLGS